MNKSKVIEDIIAIMWKEYREGQYCGDVGAFISNVDRIAKELLLNEDEEQEEEL